MTGLREDGTRTGDWGRAICQADPQEGEDGNGMAVTVLRALTDPRTAIAPPHWT
jgi:hypothetical protein